MPYECPKHGKIRSIGKAISFCPKCGGEATYIWFTPIYVATGLVKWVVRIISIVSLIVILLMFLVIPGINGCIENDRLTAQREKDKIDNIRQPWRNLYIQLKSAQYSDKIDVLESFLVSNTGELNMMTDMTSDELELIYETFQYSDKLEASKKLAPYLAGRSK